MVLGIITECRSDSFRNERSASPESPVFRADDGERISVIWWKDLETLTAWRNHPRHRVAQKAGRERWYENYSIEIAEVVRGGAFERPAGE